MLNINYATMIDPVLSDVRRAAPDFAGMKKGDSVLDVCCGSGAQVYEYALKGLAATGIDNSPEMLALAARYFDSPVDFKATFRLADASNLPIADCSFDFSSISLALHDKEEELRDRIVSEMKRVTRKGGGLLFIDFSHPLPHNIIACVIRTVEFFAGAEHHGNFKHYMKTGGLRRILQRNGLTAAKEGQMKGGCVTLMLAFNR